MFRSGRLLVFLLLSAALFAQNPSVTVTVDVQANRHAINPLIYGVNLFEPTDPNILEDLNSPINRYGGNRASTYNWQLNSDNRGNDFYFESITDDVNTHPGQRTDDFISNSKAGSAEPMVTVPMLDWIAQAGTQRPFPCSYPVTRFPNQDDFDPYDGAPSCGSGRNPDHSLITNNVKNDDFVANNSAYQQGWVQHTINTKGLAANGGLKYYILDNEPDIWFDTHRDVVSVAPHYTAHFQLLRDYAVMIKSQDAGALVAGPEVSGWLGYIYSPFDDQDGHNNNFVGPHVDHDAIGGDYMPWLLRQFQAYETQNHKRLLDVFTVHYYPQGGDNNSNTRSLWDPNFVDPSFIGDTIQLIPRMKQWVAQNYPGTKIGITEYNWGSISNEDQTDNMAQGVTQADVLGIFGREGLDIGTRFNSPPPNLPTYNSFKMYRNYDGAKSTFGDVSVSATSAANPDNVVAFAAQRSADSKVTIMLLSKYAAGNTPVTLNVANFTAASSVPRFELSGNGTSIPPATTVNINNGTVSLSLPPTSVTLLVLSPPQQAPAPTVTLNTASLNFGTQILNSYTNASLITVTNSGNANLNLSNISLNGAGLFANKLCPGTLTPGQSCTVGITPTAAGALNGTLTLTDNAADSPQTVTITGTGRVINVQGARPSRSMRLRAQTSPPQR